MLIEQVLSIGHTVFYFEQTSSTNILARNLIERGASKGSVVYSGNQYAGKGQGNNLWLSEPNQNLLATVILIPNQLNPENLFVFNMAVANAVAATVELYAEVEAFIKWPNDIYVNNFKISGLLLESVLFGQTVKHVCAGIGLNINQIEFPSTIRATSLKQINSKDNEVLFVLRELCNQLNNRLEAIDEIRVFEEYNSKLWQKNVLMRFLINERVVYAKIKSVDYSGKLILSINDEDFSFNHGEIGFLFNEN